MVTTSQSTRSSQESSTSPDQATFPRMSSNIATSQRDIIAMMAQHGTDTYHWHSLMQSCVFPVRLAQNAAIPHLREFEYHGTSFDFPIEMQCIRATHTKPMRMHNVTVFLEHTLWDSVLMHGTTSSMLDEAVSEHRTREQLLELSDGFPETIPALEWIVEAVGHRSDYKLLDIRVDRDEWEDLSLKVDLLVSQKGDRDWYERAKELEDVWFASFPSVASVMTIVPWPERRHG